MIATFRPDLIVRPSVRDTVEAFLARIEPDLWTIARNYGGINRPPAGSILRLIGDARDEGTPKHWANVHRPGPWSGERRRCNSLKTAGCALCHRVDGAYRLGVVGTWKPSWSTSPDDFWLCLREWEPKVGPSVDAETKWREWARLANVHVVEDPEVDAIAEFLEAVE